MSECRKRMFNVQQPPRNNPAPVAASSQKQPGNDPRAPVDTSVRRDTKETGRQVMTVEVNETVENREVPE